MMEGEKMKSHKKDVFEVEVFFPLRILTSPIFEETVGALFFFLFFSFLFLIIFLSLLFYAPSLEDLGVFDDI
jgi:hypothetical protein